MYMNYDEFIENKKVKIVYSGIEVSKSNLNSMLFDFQKDIVKWALHKGKACIFADCGLGKSPMQLEWANQVCNYTNSNVLILAPLAVSKQTQREGDKFGINVNVCRSHNDVTDGINITNYEMLHKFDLDSFAGVVLDESSILKSFSGKIRNQIIDAFKDVEYKLACTATPAPNDFMELGNHSEFVDVMDRNSMLSTFFVHDGGETSKWRLKKHAENKYWEWLSTWAVVIQKPSDLGYDDKGFRLKDINVIENIIDTPRKSNELVVMPAKTLSERRKVRKESLNERVKKVADLVNNSDEQWLVWCDFNIESEMLGREIEDSVEVRGSTKPDIKSKYMLGFSNGDYRVLVTKPSIAGFGMNWQNCHNMAFCGISDSYEQYYQAVRRCWRFGQANNVNVHIVISDREVESLKNIQSK
jgi:superfamily II DNA or RNA helicase